MLNAHYRVVTFLHVFTFNVFLLCSQMMLRISTVVCWKRSGRL